MQYGRDGEQPALLRVPVRYGDASRNAQTILQENSANSMPSRLLITTASRTEIILHDFADSCVKTVERMLQGRSDGGPVLDSWLGARITLRRMPTCWLPSR